MPVARTAVVVITAVTLASAACAAESTTAGGASGSMASATRGQELFSANCAACHGPVADGTDVGPPLVHQLYVPSHHADEAFQIAVQLGARPHHWDFGAMPAVVGVDRDDVADIIAYVRELQRDAGLID